MKSTHPVLQRKALRTSGEKGETPHVTCSKSNKELKSAFSSRPVSTGLQKAKNKLTHYFLFLIFISSCSSVDRAYILGIEEILACLHTLLSDDTLY